MSKITESAVSGQDQFLDSAQSLRDYLQASVRQALRCVIEQEVGVSHRLLKLQGDFVL